MMGALDTAYNSRIFPEQTKLTLIIMIAITKTGSHVASMWMGDHAAKFI